MAVLLFAPNPGDVAVFTVVLVLLAGLSALVVKCVSDAFRSLRESREQDSAWRTGR